jgi:hypothetical protein
MSEGKSSWPPPWWKVTGLAVSAGGLVFLVGELLDWRWQNSLRQTRCTVLSVKTQGKIQVTPAPRRDEARAKWVEDTTVLFQVEGGGQLRTVQPFNDFEDGQVRDCWVAGDRLSLNPPFERFLRRMDNGQLALAAVMAIFLGWGALVAMKNAGLEWPF